MPEIKLYIGPITGIMLGFELSEDEKYNFLIIDLVFLEIVIEWDK